jgi:DNA primase
LALRNFLEYNTNVTHCHICTDNDKAGNLAADRIEKIPGITTERILPSIGKDWNDCLMAAQRIERTYHSSNLQREELR